jgi:hypothetical protein
MGGHDPVVQQAIDNVIKRRSEDDWRALPTHRRTLAIYEEIKRLDAEMVSRTITVRTKRNKQAFKLA